MRLSFLILLMSIILSSKLSFATDIGNCSNYVRDVLVESKLATASLYANLRNKSGSISFETKQMLDRAEDNIQSAIKPQDLCPSNCKLPSEPLVIFKSTPNKYLVDYDQSSKCNAMLVDTTKNPIAYNHRVFDSLKSLEDWFGDLLQGKGSDGKDLYNKCDGQCSPQYTCNISNNGNNFTLDAKVVCGPARDKDDNQYKISYSYRSVCQKQMVSHLDY